MVWFNLCSFSQTWCYTGSNSIEYCNKRDKARLYQMSRKEMDLAQHQHEKYELCEKGLEIKVKKRRERCMRQGNFSYLAIHIIYIIYYFNLSHVFVN